MHVAWNLLARREGRDGRLLWWALAAHGLLLGPWGLYVLLTEVDWTREFVMLMTVSAGANVAYFLALDRAYHHAPVALVYPIARSSPLLIALWSLFLFGESLGALAWGAIFTCVAGLALLASSAWRQADGYALPWALAAALMTSVYSLSDKAALAYLPGPAAILGFLTVGYACSWMTLSLLLYREQGRMIPARRPSAAVVLAGGLCVGPAYLLVIDAMRDLPAAVVVAFTNGGIVLAGLCSIFWFHERHAWRIRLAGIAIVTGGLVLLGFSRS